MTQQTIDQLIQALRSSNWETQLAASQQLVQLGTAAVESLIDVMREYPTKEVFYSTPHNLHNMAENTLVLIGEPAIEPLIRAVSEDNFGARVGAILCLGNLREARAVQPLIDALWRDDGTTYGDIDMALEKIGDAAVRPLIHALESSSAEIRRNAAAILGFSFKDLIAVPALIRLLKDENLDVRSSASNALGRLEDAQAIEPLIAALEENDPDVRETIVRALAQIGSKVDSPRIIETLVKAMHDEDWETRQSAAEMLIWLESVHIEEARALLLDDLRSDDEEIRMGAAQALADVEATDISDVLTELLDHPDLAICARAASMLGKYGSERTIPLLIPLLSHNDTNLKVVVQSALRRLGYELGSEGE